MKNRILEVCIDSVDSAIAACRGGADRIEMCGNLVIGGTTASPILYQEIRKAIDIPIRALIRPRFGDFCYSEHEFDICCGEVVMFREMGADGVVVGCLQENGEINMPQMEKLVELAGDMNITFHRAFDVCRDPYLALEQIKELGIGTILTSGQKNNFQEGKELLKELVLLAGDDVEIMVGAGVTPESLEETASYIGASAYHMSGKIKLDSAMTYRKEGINMGLPSLSEFEIWQTSEDNVRRARNILDRS